MKELRGKTAVLTGGSRGIGPYIGRALAREGVQLALAARSADELDTVAQELAALGVRTLAIPTGVVDEAARRALVARAEAELGPIDILVNNAGILAETRFVQQAPEDIARIIDTNLMAPLLLTRQALPGMLERGRGHIVTIASMAGKKGVPYEIVYSATKAALVEWTNGLRIELEGTGVSASVICPGFVSEAGMFAVSGRRAPRLAGEVSPERVARAVVRALQRDLQEVLVTPTPIRPLLALNALSPGLGNALLQRMGVYDLLRELADEREKES